MTNNKFLRIKKIISADLIVRGLFFLVALFLIAQSDPLADLSLKSIVFILKPLGASLSLEGSSLLLKGLLIPWSPDCAGTNFLAALLLLAVIMIPSEPIKLLILRFITVLPVAFLANIARVFLLLLLRLILYPNWENDEIHMLAGFLIMPPALFIMLKIPYNIKEVIQISFLRIIYCTVIFSLAAGKINEPNGIFSLFSSFILLAGVNKYQEKINFIPISLWFASGVLLAFIRIDSFWLAWVIIFPCFFSVFASFKLKNIPYFLLLAGTVPVFLFNKFIIAIVIVSGLFALAEICLTQIDEEDIKSQFDMSKIQRNIVSVFLSLALFMPFIVPFMNFHDTKDNYSKPPEEISKNAVGLHGWQLKIAGMPIGTKVFWYEARKGDRHHALYTCLRFGGKKPVPFQDKKNSNALLSDGYWLKEFFLHKGRLIETYDEYIFSSLFSGYDKGVHIIIEAPANLPYETREKAEKALRRFIKKYYLFL
ncbi:MAG: archaeosortase/exosortase family protein [Desulfobacterales bacterium]|nr:archaeosortase/exosortase family protein [Desulfobacterales bacterium]MBF0397820.1 archaeosortase/exosortase family protein [Desulfobacterales bacterium]